MKEQCRNKDNELILRHNGIAYVITDHTFFFHHLHRLQPYKEIPPFWSVRTI